MKKILFCTAFVFIIIALIKIFNPYSTAEAPVRTVRNLDGHVIKVPAEIRRVACFYGPSYEKVALLGAEDKIAVCSVFHKTLSPWQNKIFTKLKEIPAYTSAHSPNLEELVNLKLDIVFFWNFPNMVGKITDIGIPVVYPIDIAGQKVEDMKRLLNVYAEALGGNALKTAMRYAEYFDLKLNMVKSVTSTIPDNKKPSVYFAVRKPLHTAGKGSAIPELVELAGGISVQRDLAGGYGKEIGVEQLLQWNPEIIILDHCGAKSMGSAPIKQIFSEMISNKRFENMRAVKNKKVFMSPTGVFFWDSGQQVILQLMWMAKIFHPDKFEYIDMKKELKEFYGEFFKYQLTDDEAERILLNLPPKDI